MAATLSPNPNNNDNNTTTSINDNDTTTNDNPANDNDQQASITVAAAADFAPSVVSSLEARQKRKAARNAPRDYLAEVTQPPSLILVYIYP